jgi:hypothetical protein
MSAQIQGEYRDLVKKDSEVGQRLQAFKEERFKVEQKIIELKTAKEKLAEEQTRTSIPWHRQFCALIGLYGMTLWVFVAIAAVFFGMGYLTGSNNPLPTSIKTQTPHPSLKSPQNRQKTQQR